MTVAGSLAKMATRLIFVCSALAALSGCGSLDSLTGTTSGVAPGIRGSQASLPQAEMTGRWTFSSPGRGVCVMNFGVNPGAPEGTIAPEGGCPGNFFTSRRWVFERDALVIRDHTGETLARLAQAGPGRFDGQSTAGEPVTLAR
jgi:hypothetical protein